MNITMHTNLQVYFYAFVYIWIFHVHSLFLASLKSFKRRFTCVFICLSFSSICMYTTCMQYLQRPVEGVRFPLELKLKVVSYLDKLGTEPMSSCKNNQCS